MRLEASEIWDVNGIGGRSARAHDDARRANGLHGRHRLHGSRRTER